MRGRTVIALFLLMAFSGLLPERSFPKDNQAAGSPLKGIKGIFVFVSGPGAGAAGNGLKEEISMDVVSVLRHHDVKVLTKEEYASSPGSAMLFVAVDMLKLEEIPNYAYSITYEVREAASLIRTGADILASTWSSNSYGIVPSAAIGGIRDKLKEKTGKFVEAYLSVNPAMPPPTPPPSPDTRSRRDAPRLRFAGQGRS